MKRVKAIIGANFGDEGKGLMTDYFCDRMGKSPLEVVNIRFNGGAQSSHTVQVENGLRHAFGHFGAGTMTGAVTYLSEYFVVNPRLFRKEFDELLGKRIPPFSIMDENCLVTTPWDVLINQAMEKHRGGARHGSCGIGFNETIHRNQTSKYKIRVKDLTESWLPDILEEISNKWVYDRFTELGVHKIPNPTLMIMEKAKAVNDRFKDDSEFMLLATMVSNRFEVFSHFNDLVFEGGQGLLLDEDSRFFPYVSRSKTGLTNILKLLDGVLYDEAEVIYVTRSYLTRHGAGPLANELGRPPYPGVVDQTNMYNQYQGSLRFAYFDLPLTLNGIDHDLSLLKDHPKFDSSLAITCVDQIEKERVKFHIAGENSLPLEDFLGYLGSVFQRIVNNCYTSSGPTRNTITKRRVNEWVNLGYSTKPATRS